MLRCADGGNIHNNKGCVHYHNAASNRYISRILGSSSLTIKRIAVTSVAYAPGKTNNVTIVDCRIFVISILKKKK